MKLSGAVLVFMLLTVSFPIQGGDDFCGAKNMAFQYNETLTYKIYYTLAGVFIAGGEAVFTSTLENLNGKTVYHIIGDGKTNSFMDGIFKVRDKYETYIDTGTLQPYRFIRNVDEGGFKIYENVSFNKTTDVEVTNKGVYKVPTCIQDVLSAIYYARNLNFNKVKANDTIPFSMFLDNQVYNLYIRFLGKEVIKTKYGKFRAIKFRPLLIKGTIFTGGEKMTVWVTDDPNHVPLRVESPISVGSIKVDMMDFRNRRSPMTALLDVR